MERPPSSVDLLAEAEARLAEAEARVLEDASEDNVRRLEYWRRVVRMVLAQQRRTEGADDGGQATGAG